MSVSNEVNGFGACLQTLSNGDLASCKLLGFGLIEWLTIIGALGAALIWLLGLLKARRQASEGGRFRTFRGLRKALKPLMKENARIFREFGPNSGANAEGSVRFDLSVWYRARGQIANNNQSIANLIRDNADRIPQVHQADFAQWLSHIDAFAAHLQDETVDYRQHRFPESVNKIVLGK